MAVAGSKFRYIKKKYVSFNKQPRNKKLCALFIGNENKNFFGILHLCVVVFRTNK